MTPYLSVVVAARNDNYGGNFLSRLQTFADCLLEQLARHAADAEVIVVEWNPPAENPPLIDAVKWNEESSGRVRIVQVPPALHHRLPNADRMPMFEYRAKNVGIRRARGEFVLATNPDLLFTDELIAYIASRGLKQQRFYRADRYDFKSVPPRRVARGQAADAAKRTVYQVNIRESPRGLTVPVSWVSRQRVRLTGRWPGSHDGYSSASEDDCVVRLSDPVNSYDGLHTNAAGDFILAAKKHWSDMRGFPEATDTYTHLDSYGVHQLHSLGLQQVVFKPPCMVLHADHPRSEQSSRPRVDSSKWQDDLARLRRHEIGPALNDADWGFGRDELPECSP